MFNDSRLLDCVAYGSQFGHEFNTRIKTLRSGHENRNADWQMPRYRFAVLYRNLAEDDHDKVYFAHMACMGSLIGFRFKDWRDFAAIHQPLGETNGAAQTLQLFKTYTFGTVEFIRTIKKPVQGSITFYVDGIATAATVNYDTGEFVITGPPGGVITASFEFDVPVRFVSDRLNSEPVARTGSAGLRLTSDVDLIEVRT